jgi:hypothetical protein
MTSREQTAPSATALTRCDTDTIHQAILPGRRVSSDKSTRLAKSRVAPHPRKRTAKTGRVRVGALKHRHARGTLATEPACASRSRALARFSDHRMSSGRFDACPSRRSTGPGSRGSRSAGRFRRLPGGSVTGAAGRSARSYRSCWSLSSRRNEIHPRRIKIHPRGMNFHARGIEREACGIAGHPTTMPAIPRG